MNNTIKIKVTTDTIMELQIIINDKIKKNREEMRLNRKIGMSKYNYLYIKRNKELKKIHKALKGVKQILIQEVFK